MSNSDSPDVPAAVARTLTHIDAKLEIYDRMRRGEATRLESIDYSFWAQHEQIRELHRIAHAAARVVAARAQFGFPPELHGSSLWLQTALEDLEAAFGGRASAPPDPIATEFASPLAGGPATAMGKPLAHGSPGGA